MSNVNLSANMNLPIPVTNNDPGPDWANNINAALTIVDGHNHSNGSGVPINPSGLNISADLPFLGNNATLLRSVRFSPQNTAIALTSDVGCLYEVGVDLYYNDGSGNQIRFTQSGSLAGASGTITGLPNGTASASYGSGVFVFQSATNTSAAIDAGSIILRNNTSASKGLTLSPPNSMGANYGLTLPPLPGSSGNFLTIDTSGNIGSSVSIDNSSLVVTSNVLQINSGGVTQAMLAARATGSPGSTVPAGGIANSGSISSSSSSSNPVLLGGCGITTTGRPISILCTSLTNIGGATPGGFSVICTGPDKNPTGTVYIYNSTTSTYVGSFYFGPNSGTSALGSSVGPYFQVIDIQSAGTYTYQLYFSAVSTGTSGPGSATISCFNINLIAYEL